MNRKLRRPRIQEIDTIVADDKVLGITVVYDRYVNDIVEINILYNTNRLRRCCSLDDVPKKYKHIVEQMIGGALA